MFNNRRRRLPVEEVERAAAKGHRALSNSLTFQRISDAFEIERAETPVSKWLIKIWEQTIPLQSHRIYPGSSRSNRVSGLASQASAAELPWTFEQLQSS
jgi:hypothetical protein